MSKLRIGGDVSAAKKSILSLGKELKNLGKNKISIFSEKDRNFIKNELNKELGEMKAKLSESRAEVAKLAKEQAKLAKGTELELQARRKILQEYQKQAKIANDMGGLNQQKSALGGFGTMLGGAALAVGSAAVYKGYQGAKQYKAGADSRVRLKGLGVFEDSFGSPEQLARSGLTEQELIRRRIEGVSRLGRAGASNESIMQQATFERSYGLEGGSMQNIAGALRGSFGGSGANQAQMKLQASVLASGIEDAIGPYLESATELLADINKNGMTNTDEMIRVMAEMTKMGQRTPEQIAEAFRGVDSAVRGSSGEANAFFQTAFARGGIGGGTIGATRLAMSSGGIFGLNPEELSNRGYNPELIKNMEGAGFTKGVGDRSSAILNQFKRSAGLSEGQSISGITDLNTMTGIAQMANSTLGTQGLGGFDAVQMLEQVQNKQMSQKQFDDKLQDLRAQKDPTLDRLTKINETLAGQTTVLNDINTNLLENLGKSTIKAANIATEADNILTQGTGNVAGAIDSTGIGEAGLAAAKAARSNLTGGGLGDKLYNMMHGSPEEENAKLFRDAETRFSKKGNMPLDQDSMAKAVQQGMTAAMQSQKTSPVQNNNKININLRTGDGRVTNKTHK